MPLGRGARLGLGIVGGVGLLVAAGLAALMAPSGTGREDVEAPAAAGASRAAEADPSGPEAAPERSTRSIGLASGSPEALEEAVAAMVAVPEQAEAETQGPRPATPMDAVEVDAWRDDLAGIGAGFTRYPPTARARIIGLIGVAMDRLAAEPTPEGWSEVLTPTAEVLTAGMADPSPAVRAEAVGVIGQLWTWEPGRLASTKAEQAVASWKNRLQTPLDALVKDPEPGVRLATLIALGKLPIDAMAAPALALLEDPVPAVRLQLLNSFAHRRELLTDDAILPRLYDNEVAVSLAAQLVLRARGLSDDQIGLAGLLYHPRAEERAKAVPLIEGREDIDPIVWLVQLSRDEAEPVRSEALGALVRRASPDARRRVAEMADSDPSPTLRDAARHALDALTADLPALPVATNLNPRAQ